MEVVLPASIYNRTVTASERTLPALPKWLQNVPELEMTPSLFFPIAAMEYSITTSLHRLALPSTLVIQRSSQDVSRTLYSPILGVLRS